MAKHRDVQGPYTGPDRRRRPRDPQGTQDWESVALQRVAHRVRSLADTGSGWEKDVVKRLRRHLDETGDS